MFAGPKDSLARPVLCLWYIMSLVTVWRQLPVAPTAQSSSGYQHETPNLASASAAEAALGMRLVEQLVAAGGRPDIAALVAGRRSCTVAEADFAACLVVACSAALAAVRHVALQASLLQIRRRRRWSRPAQVHSSRPRIMLGTNQIVACRMHTWMRFLPSGLVTRGWSLGVVKV